MSEDEPTMSASLRDRLRWWLYDRCFAYCVRCIHPDADPADFTILDNTYFVAIGKDEVREIIEEAPAIAWHFQHEALP